MYGFALNIYDEFAGTRSRFERVGSVVVLQCEAIVFFHCVFQYIDLSATWRADEENLDLFRLNVYVSNHFDRS